MPAPACAEAWQEEFDPSSYSKKIESKQFNDGVSVEINDTHRPVRSGVKNREVGKFVCTLHPCYDCLELRRVRNV